MQQAGVCRDTHSVIGIVEAQLGIPHSVVVSFAQISGGYHATWAGQDPDHPLVNHQIDWSRRVDTTGGSSRSLFQGGSDIALNYRLYRPAGSGLADIQSQQGLWLAGAAGFRPADPLTRNEGYTVSGGAALGANGHTQAIIAAGQDGNGANYAVGGVRQEWGQDGHAPGQAALLVGTQQRTPAAMGNTDGKTYNLDFIYAQVEQNSAPATSRSRRSCARASRPRSRQSRWWDATVTRATSTVASIRPQATSTARATEESGPT